jgi:hypothetical protein
MKLNMENTFIDTKTQMYLENVTETKQPTDFYFC